jgi:hypothetical protein
VPDPGPRLSPTPSARKRARTHAGCIKLSVWGSSEGPIVIPRASKQIRTTARRCGTHADKSAAVEFC